MSDIQRRNLDHVLESMGGLCTDPDCELHNPEVGVDEEVVSLTDLAFFLAGADTMACAIAKAGTVAEGREAMDERLIRLY